MPNIGLFGLTASPPHVSHCYVIRQALKQCDEVYVSLVYKHPFNKSFIDYTHRKNMLTLITKEYFSIEEMNKVKLIEVDKNYFENTKEIPFSYNILREIKSQNYNNNIKLIIGEDNYKPETWSRFFKNKEIEEEFGLIIVPDNGFHSTQVRELMLNVEENKGLLIKLCGNSVFHYMKNNNLY